MTKLRPTYRTPYFYPSQGDLISPEQVAFMCEHELVDGALGTDRSWRAFYVSDGRLAVDFTDLDGYRQDWFNVRTNGTEDHARFLCVPTFANGQKLWLVTHTSY